MVPNRTTKKKRGLPRGQVTGSNIAVNARTIEKIFFNLCEDCKESKMAAIPPSAFSAGRIRESQRDMKISKITKGGGSNKFFNTQPDELTPLKYNSKLMNSIWGFYNRYSPHNVKKVTENIPSATEFQQNAANSNKNDMLSLPAKLDKIWAAINVSQSH